MVCYSKRITDQCGNFFRAFWAPVVGSYGHVPGSRLRLASGSQDFGN